jgi:glycosyltransferase involved in cell wall biosynthesis
MSSLRRSVRRAVRHCAMAFGYPIARVVAGRPPKRITAMMRVRNEVEFLEKSINSIIDHVDDMVIVDNCSEDGSTAVIANFVSRFPVKIQAFRYPHSIARYGEETLRLASTKEGKRSPSFLPNYYNWCVAKCSGPYILKWDGDTVATDALATAIERFRRSTKQILWHTGVNLHSDRISYIAGRPFEWMEPRLFFKRLSSYRVKYPAYVESLWSPYGYLYPSFSEREPEPLYFHMKFCKRDRFSNMSRDLQLREEAISDRGEPLPKYLRDQVISLGL